MEAKNVQKRATSSLSGERTADYGLDYGEVLEGRVLVWPVAADYRIAPGGFIVPEPGCKPHRGPHNFSPPSPLKDIDLYLSFAELAHGAKVKQRILEWVSEHGLLTRKDPARAGSEMLEGNMVNQMPMRIEDFIDHVTKFDSLLRLYAEIGSGNIKTLQFVEKHVPISRAAGCRGR